MGIRAALLPLVLLLALPVTAQPLPAGRLHLDADRSRIELFVRDNRGGFRGRATEMEGSAVIRQTGEFTYTAQVEVRVPARSVTTGLGLRDAQMHRAHLHTDRYPLIRFTGTVLAERVRIASEFPAEVRGTLSLHGVDRELSAPARVTPLPNGFRGRAEFVVRMSDHGIPIPRFWIFVAEDPVQVTVDLVFHTPTSQ